VVTRGAEGALVQSRDGRAEVPVARPVRADACGAGDRFAATVCASLGAGQPLLDAVRAAVAQAAGFVARGGAAAFGPPSQPAAPAAPSAAELARRVRDVGGTVVAAGGCFDLLHAGHVALLRAARELGDCLIVCLNSDASVRRLKGPSRPLVGERDRAALLEALDCVDAVVVFDEHTPRQALERLRPHVFVKGGDYAGTELAEAGVLRRWGGRVEILPFVEGRSTTRLIEEASRVG
jgi:D-beta-D-heptose 7-phosphate kinase/D-beta-D-heptose 1-phosphate adenosyltransferase